MQATIASWLMATLTPSAFMVALVQTASTLPTLLFGLLAGAMSDIVDRRKVILVTISILGIASLQVAARCRMDPPFIPLSLNSTL